MILISTALSRPLRRILLVLGLLVMASGARAQGQPACEGFVGQCVPVGTSGDTCPSGQSAQEDFNCGQHGGQTYVCCVSNVCAERPDGVCLAGTQCPAGRDQVGVGGCAPSGEICCTATVVETCAQRSGTTNYYCNPATANSCVIGFTNLGTTSDCASCCIPPVGPSETCNNDQVCQAGEPCSCDNCASTAACQAAASYRVEYVHTDALGSVRMVTDGGGAVVSRLDYYPFGERIEGNGRTAVLDYTPADVILPQRFTGKERDGESSLDYFGARYYSGAQGRFTSVDPALDIGSTLRNPQGWNRYVYGDNNPLVNVDRDGRQSSIPLMLPSSVLDAHLVQQGKISPEEFQARSNQRARAAAAISAGTLLLAAGGELVAGARALVTAAFYWYNTPVGRNIVNEVAEATAGAPAGSLGRTGLSAAAKGGVLLGETMDRVTPIAKRIGPQMETFNELWSGDKADMMAKNMAWLATQIKNRTAIFDIGFDVTRTRGSDFYAAEVAALQAAGWVRRAVGTFELNGRTTVLYQWNPPV